MSTGQTIGRGAGAEAADVELGDGLEYMTADELARRLRVSTAWVYTETRAGRIPHIRLRRYVRFRRSTIAAWERDTKGARDDRLAQARRCRQGPLPSRAPGCTTPRTRGGSRRSGSAGSRGRCGSCRRTSTGGSTKHGKPGGRGEGAWLPLCLVVDGVLVGVVTLDRRCRRSSSVSIAWSIASQTPNRGVAR